MHYKFIWNALSICAVRNARCFCWWRRRCQRELINECILISNGWRLSSNFARARTVCGLRAAVFAISLRGICYAVCARYAPDLCRKRRLMAGHPRARAYCSSTHFRRISAYDGWKKICKRSEYIFLQKPHAQTGGEMCADVGRYHVFDGKYSSDMHTIHGGMRADS